MTFRQFIHILAERIGMHQIPVVDGASEIREFLTPDAVHHELITTLVRDIYKTNRCGHLDARINADVTRTTIGAMRASILTEKGTDVCRYRLVNQVCDSANEILAEFSSPVTGNAPSISRTGND